MRLLCIDGNSVMNRAFYGIRLLSNRKGVYTNALFGFLNILLKLQKDHAPDRIVVTFDRHAPTFRHAMYAEYKGTRKGMPEELRMQMPYIKQIIAALGYPMFEIDGYEADDLLGTLSLCCENEGFDCIVATGDRDCLQLIGEKTKVLLIKTKENILYDEAQLKADFGVSPNGIIELKALMGDSSDNIPGVKGIGEKTALGLLEQAGDIDTLYRNLDTVKATDRIKNLLRGAKETAEMSKQLATICRTAPIDFAAAKAAALPQEKALFELLTELEMLSFLDKFDLKEKVLQGEEAQKPTAAHTVIKDGKLLEAVAVFSAKEQFDFIFTGSCLQLWEERSGTIYVYEELLEEAFANLLTLPAKKRTYLAKPVYRYALTHDITVEPFSFDLEIAAYLLLPTASDYTMESMRLKYGVNPADKEFADILSLSALCDALDTQIKENGLSYVMDEIEMPLCNVLASMEHDGFTVDGNGLAAYGDILKLRVEEAKERIFVYADEEFNPNSTKELGHILFEKLGLPARKKTKTGYSTNAEVLEELRGFHPIIDAILEYRKMSKLHSTYIVGLLKEIGADGRVHSTFKQTLTRTGRISSTEPNVQNIPVRSEEGGEIRRYFVAKEGCTLVDADYSQIELRVLAHMADDKQMLYGFEHGADIHRMTASQVFGVPFEEVTPQQRSSSKAINFGIVYGIGAFSLSKDIHVSVAQAKAYIDSYLRTYSGVKNYMAKTIADAQQNGYVTTLYGRRRDVSDINASNKIRKALGERIAMNTPIQGTAADIIKLAMVKVFTRLQKEAPDARLILQVHDELIIECKQEQAERIGKLLVEEMESAASLKVKLEADVHQGQNWLEAKG